MRCANLQSLSNIFTTAILDSAVECMASKVTPMLGGSSEAPKVEIAASELEYAKFKIYLVHDYFEERKSKVVVA